MKVKRYLKYRGHFMAQREKIKNTRAEEILTTKRNKRVEKPSIFMWRPMVANGRKYWRRVGPFVMSDNNVDRYKSRGFKLWENMTSEERYIADTDFEHYRNYDPVADKHFGEAPKKDK